MTTRFAVLNESTGTFVKKGQFAGHLYRRQERAERKAESQPHFTVATVQV